jgi:ribosomal protein L16/L10AE
MAKDQDEMKLTIKTGKAITDEAIEAAKKAFQAKLVEEVGDEAKMWPFQIQRQQQQTQK